MVAHRGLRQFSGDESGNVAIGQLGFQTVTGTSNTLLADGTTSTTGITDGSIVFVAIKCLSDNASTAACTVTVESLQGDSFSGLKLFAGDIIWGCFNFVNITTNASSDCTLLCYYGKKEFNEI